MRKLTKTFMCLTLAAITAASAAGLSACGGKKSAEGEIWIGASEQGLGLKWLEQSIEEFKTVHPEYTVTIKDRSAEYGERAQADLLSGTCKNDLLLISNINFVPFARSGKLVDLSDVYAAPYNSQSTIESVLTDGSKKLAQAPGPDGNFHYYAMKNEALAGLVYNKTVADYYEQGTSGKTWNRSVKKIADVKTVDHLVAWVKEINTLSKTYPFEYKDGEGSGEVAGYVYPGQYMNYWDNVISTWWAQYSGITVYNKFFEMDSADVYSDEARLQALKALEKLKVKDYQLSGAESASHIEAQNALISGRALVMPTGSWIETENNEYLKQCGTELAMISVPYINASAQKAGRNYLYASGGDIALAVNTGDESKIKIVKEFLAFLYSEQEILRFTRLTGSPRPIQGNYEDGLEENGELTLFAANCFRLRNEAEDLIYDAPNDVNAKNYLLYFGNFTSKWCVEVPYKTIIQGQKTPQQVFDEEKARAVDKFPSWLAGAGL